MIAGLRLSFDSDYCPVSCENVIVTAHKCEKGEKAMSEEAVGGRSAWRQVLACLGGALGVPWWPTLAAFGRSYMAGTFPSTVDHAALLAFFAALLVGFVVFLVRRDAEEVFRAARHFAMAGAAATFALQGVACVPSEVDGLLRAVGAAFAGGSTACLVVAWQAKAVHMPVEWVAVRIGAGLLCASALVYLGMSLSEPAVLVIATLLTATSFTLLSRVVDTGTSGVSREVPSQASCLFFAMRGRLRAKLFAAGLLASFAFSSMLYRFISASYDRVPEALFLAGCAGVVVFIALTVVSTVACREVNSVLVFRLSMVAVVPAFFPMEPGSRLSIVFALAFALLAVFVVMGSFALVLDDASICADLGDQRSALVGWCGVALGALGGVAMGLVSCTSPGSQLPGYHTVGISLLGLTAMICTFVATSVLIGRDALRDLRFLSVGKLPVSYTLYEGEPGLQPADDMGLLASCKKLALVGGLTQRESEVLVILARGSSLAKVQEELFISQGTAITHRNSIYRKLDIHSRQELLDRIDALRIGGGRKG